jgi:predicted HTH transcriptional regulator
VKIASSYIKNLINEGEHQQLDFKFCITDSKKIARTLAAFSNTDGGKLLIGVKDNGAIAGVRTEEEYYMVEAAAQMYCKPEIHFQSKSHLVDGKTILEITIFKSIQKPHIAPDEDGNWVAFIRVNDQNLLADDILLEVWKRKKEKQPVIIKYSNAERVLLNYLTTKQQITLNRFCKIAQIPVVLAKKILVDFIILEIIDIIPTEQKTIFQLNQTNKGKTLSIL